MTNTHNIPTSSSRGFSLMEISVVLVIIGLIAGGVVGGKALIESSQLQSTIVFINRTQNAYVSFLDKYEAMPGDMVNASTYWSGAPNGDGDNTYDTWAANSNPESFALWYHLSAAGFIKESFTGVIGSGATIGTNVPAVPINRNTTALVYYGDLTATYASHNSIVLMQPSYANSIPVLDAQAIDQKIDDGKPFLGTIISLSNGTNGICTSVDISATPNAATRLTTTYRTNPNEKCTMHFALGTWIWK